jgi:hypothetical protein
LHKYPECVKKTVFRKKLPILTFFHIKKLNYGIIELSDTNNAFGIDVYDRYRHLNYDYLKAGENMTRNSNAGYFFVTVFAINMLIPGSLYAYPSVTPDWITSGNTTAIGYGTSVSSAGHLKNGSTSAILVGAPNYSSNRGAVYVYYKTPTGLPVTPDKIIVGDENGSSFGIAVSGAGDINNDGYDDVVIGANKRGGSNKGAILVFFGSDTGLKYTADWVYQGTIDNAQLGTSVSYSDSIYGDSRSAIIAGAPGYDNYTGAVYVFFGSVTGPSASDYWFKIGPQQRSSFGTSVSGTGDVKRNGYYGVLVGASFAKATIDTEGVVYAYYCSSEGLPGSESWKYGGGKAYAQFGNSLAATGDIDGDGYGDVIVGARFYSNPETQEGAVFLFTGGASGLSATPAWRTESNYYNTSSKFGAVMGYSVSGAGDINNDGFKDVVVGAHRYMNGSFNSEGAVFVYYGSQYGLSKTANWVVKSNQKQGFFTSMVACAGTNTSGYSGIIIGAPQDSVGSLKGAALVYYGSAGGLVPSAVTSLSPGKDSVGVDTAMILWKKNNTAAYGYKLQISTTPDFSVNQKDTLLLSADDTVCSFVNSTPTTKYFWRVTIQDVSGGFVTQSDIWCFTAQLPKPFSPSPVSGTQGVPLQTALAWSLVPGANLYTVQLAANSDFNTLLIDQQTLTNSYTVPPGILNTNTTYYWRVKALNTTTTNFSWSPVWNYTTLIAAPVIVAPDSASAGLSLTPELKWNSVAGAESYTVELSLQESFPTIVFTQANLVTTTYVIPVSILSYGTTYFWRVKGAKNGIAGLSSVLWYFKTKLAVPQPGSPSNDTIGTGLTPDMQWTASPGAAYYSLQIATDQLFSSRVFSPTGLTGISVVVPADTLQHQTKYYWRVRAYTTPADTSDWSSVFSFTTVVAKPEIPVLMAPLDLSENVAINPFFAWHSAARAETYSVQVSLINDFSKDTLIDTLVGDTLFTNATSFSYDKNHFWRVGARNAAGMGGWSDIWSFSTIPTMPDSSTLIIPVDMAKDISLSPVVIWNTASGAVLYSVVVSFKPDCSDPVFDSVDLTVTSIGIPAGILITDTVYYWSVLSKNAAGDEKRSAIWSFRTIPEKPGVPALRDPDDYALNISLTPSLKWLPVKGAVHYTVHIASSGTFNDSVFLRNSVPDTEVAVPAGKLTNQVNYFWRVNAGNSGGTGDWSAARNFTTITDTPAVTLLIAPLAGDTDRLLTERLIWYTTQRAGKYRIQVSTIPDFTTTVIDTLLDTAGVAEDTTMLIPADILTKYTVYYWKVRGENNSGDGAWSDIRYFKTIPEKPGVPVLMIPVDLDTAVQTFPSLYWNAALRATSYSITIALDSDFINMVVDTPGLVNTSFTMINSLSNKTKYFWHVRATNAGGAGDWSEVWRFKTVSKTLQTPSLVRPGNTKQGIEIPVLLQWNKIPDTARYSVQIALDGAFTKELLILDTIGVNDTSLLVSVLKNYTTYYWRVKAVNTIGSSNWGNGFFITIIAPPLLVSPDDSSGGVGLEPLLKWNASAGAASYCVHVYGKEDFSDTLILDSGITGTEYAIPPDTLQYGSTYHWRVNASYFFGTSLWSTPRLFTTGISVLYPLTAGWNMVSFNIAPSDDSTAAVFGPLKGLVIVKDNEGNVYYPLFSVDGIKHLRIGQGYQLYTDSTDTIKISGAPITIATTSIALKAGWNMIACFLTREMDIDSALASIKSSIVIAKDNAGNTYMPEYSINTIGTIKPGQGYQIFMNADAVLFYPEATRYNRNVNK